MTTIVSTISCRIFSEGFAHCVTLEEGKSVTLSPPLLKAYEKAGGKIEEPVKPKPKRARKVTPTEE